ncbi:cytochrome P450 [Streptomyces sp. NBC_01264]|uniref:cytochrome P450 n=1 Tax=Streptomyces sp. NBC_01264 TaxID=2903804 RepID=UPI00224E543B|nr:cytochrome P450 [Streptomyces sp. NBC_01264]MCX4784545.1 cytochrome P450 [Streptomyces sp. NBC_01264]
MTGIHLLRGTSGAPVAPGRLPLVGHLLPLMRHPIQFLQALERLGPVVKIYLWRRPVYVLTTPELVRTLLVQDAAKVEKGFVFDKARPLLGNGLFISEGAAHLHQRRLVQPAFHQDRIHMYTNKMAAQASLAVRRWEPDRPIELIENIHELTRDIVLEALFAAHLSPDQKDRILQAAPVVLGGFIRRALYPSSVIEKIPTPANRGFDAAVRALRHTVDEIVTQASQGEPAEETLLSLLLSVRDDAGQPMSPVQIRDEAVSVLLAGTETSATSLAWLFYELARRPELQDEIAEEIKTVISEDGVTWREIPDLALMGAALNETLRLHTPNWILMRRAVLPLRYAGVSLALGSDILFSLTTLHRDPRHYPDPFRFDPERWQRDSTKSPKLFMPFAAGPHKCIGDSFAWAEMMVIAVTVLTRWRITLVAPDSVRETANSATVRPDGLRVTLHRRN